MKTCPHCKANYLLWHRCKLDRRKNAISSSTVASDDGLSLLNPLHPLSPVSVWHSDSGDSHSHGGSHSVSDSSSDGGGDGGGD